MPSNAIYPIRNVVWNGFGGIDCELQHPSFGWLPFTLVQHEYPALWDIAVALPPGPYVPPPVDLEELAAEAISQRNALLAACDWTQLPDADLTVAEVEAWAVYRQALRDISEQEGFPGVIVWPVEPSE